MHSRMCARSSPKQQGRPAAHACSRQMATPFRGMTALRRDPTPRSAGNASTCAGSKASSLAACSSLSCSSLRDAGEPMPSHTSRGFVCLPSIRAKDAEVKVLPSRSTSTCQSRRPMLDGVSNTVAATQNAEELASHGPAKAYTGSRPKKSSPCTSVGTTDGMEERIWNMRYAGLGTPCTVIRPNPSWNGVVSNRISSNTSLNVQ
mmetsp:Transcript_22509/g.72451  ORF Transcript_22509/g.72451 Transcript_22509/m.72451 type:complete len:204 (+) Transcript_22509:105-716(+)